MKLMKNVRIDVPIMAIQMIKKSVENVKFSSARKSKAIPSSKLGARVRKALNREITRLRKTNPGLRHKKLKYQ
jgi:hypothetical protein